MFIFIAFIYHTWMKQLKRAYLEMHTLTFILGLIPLWFESSQATKTYKNHWVWPQKWHLHHSKNGLVRNSNEGNFSVALSCCGWQYLKCLHTYDDSNKGNKLGQPNLISCQHCSYGDYALIPTMTAGFGAQGDKLCHHCCIDLPRPICIMYSHKIIEMFY